VWDRIQAAVQHLRATGYLVLASAIENLPKEKLIHLDKLVKPNTPVPGVSYQPSLPPRVTKLRNYIPGPLLKFRPEQDNSTGPKGKKATPKSARTIIETDSDEEESDTSVVNILRSEGFSATTDRTL
jgi:hypothetical protein